MGRFKAVLLFTLIFPILITYNNCSRSRGDLGSEYTALLSVDEAGSLKGDFEYFEPRPGCSLEEGKAAHILSVNALERASFVHFNQCSGKNSALADFNNIRTQDHNPYLVYFNRRIYASAYLHQGIAGHFYYQEYCFNQELEIDFTIQYIETAATGSSATLYDWVGVTMMGTGSDRPGIHFNGGYFVEENNDGSKIFEAMNGSYSVHFKAPLNDTEKKAIYKRPNGQRVPMTCWYYNP